MKYQSIALFSKNISYDKKLAFQFKIIYYEKEWKGRRQFYESITR